jgi:4-carboxymuconolactone decarboxylase
MSGQLGDGEFLLLAEAVRLLVAVYCGVPAAIETNRIASEIFGETGGSSDA